jgi:hypothetical protein
LSRLVPVIPIIRHGAAIAVEIAGTSPAMTHHREKTRSKLWYDPRHNMTRFRRIAVD